MKILNSISSLFRTNKSTSIEVLKIQKEGAKLAVQHAKIYNSKLDYSVDSLKKVDKILDRLSKNYLIKQNKEELENLALIFGLYIIEVFEQNEGKGYLERKLITLESDSFPYYFKGNLIFPCIWCLNKIFDNEADDVWMIYNRTVSKV